MDSVGYSGWSPTIPLEGLVEIVVGVGVDEPRCDDRPGDVEDVCLRADDGIGIFEEPGDLPVGDNEKAIDEGSARRGEKRAVCEDQIGGFGTERNGLE